jgi:hypothetical protein
MHATGAASQASARVHALKPRRQMLQTIMRFLATLFVATHFCDALVGVLVAPTDNNYRMGRYIGYEQDCVIAN